MGYTDAVLRLMMNQSAMQSQGIQQTAAMRADTERRNAEIMARSQMANGEVWAKLPGQLASLGLSAYNQYQEDKKQKTNERLAQEKLAIERQRAGIEERKTAAAEKAAQFKQTLELLPVLAPYADHIATTATPENWGQTRPLLRGIATGLGADVAQWFDQNVPEQFDPKALSGLQAMTGRMVSGKDDVSELGRAVKAKETQAGRPLSYEEMLGVIKDVESSKAPQQGHVVSPGGAFIPPGQTTPSFTNPAKPSVDTSPSSGRNPRTGKFELFTMNADGTPNWLGVEAPPTATQVSIGARGDAESKFSDSIADLPDGKPSALVQAVIDGRQDARAVLASGAARMMPNAKTELLNQILKHEPGWSEQRYQLRQKFDVAGLEHNRIVAMDTMAQHLELAHDLGKALQNKDLVLANKIINWGKTQLGWPKEMNANMATTALGTEIASALKGSNAAATDPEINAWISKLPTSQGPDQWMSNLADAANIVLGRAQSLQSDWRRVHKDYYPVLSDDSIRVMKKVGASSDIGTKAVGPTAWGVQPKAANATDIPNAVGGKRRVVGPNGQTGTVPEATTSLPPGWSWEKK